MNNRIFINSKSNGQLQGRNANIGGAMMKRAPIFTHVNIQRQQSMPFANYNCRSNESILSQSQVTEFQDRQTHLQSMQSSETVKKIVRQEIDKHNFNEQMNKKHIMTLQAQINDLKERFVELQKASINRNEQRLGTFRDQIYLQIKRTGEEVQIEISTKLRSYFQKAHLELKKEIIAIVDNDFIPKSFIDDLQLRLEQFNDKFDSIDNKILNREFKTEQEVNMSSSLIVQNMEVKVAKLQRQIQLNKKYFVQVSARIKNLEDTAYEERQKKQSRDLQEIINTHKERIKQLENQNVGICKKLGLIQAKDQSFNLQMSFMKEKLVDLQKNNDEHKFIIKNISQKISSNQQKSNLGEFLKSSQNLSNSLIINNTSNQHKAEETSILHDHSSVMDVQIDSSNPFKTFEKKQEKELQTKKSTYQVDKDGYLMDGDGRYLLTDSNQMVQLSHQQILTLSESHLIELC